MLDGNPASAASKKSTGQSDLFGESRLQSTRGRTWTEPARALIALRGGGGTRTCIESALCERWLPVDWIPDADEPRLWNQHHGREPEPAMYIGQPSPLGNPWKLDRDRPRAEQEQELLRKYKRWLWSKIDRGSATFDPAIYRSLELITDQHHLVCYCWPLACHGEVVVAAWRWRKLCELVGQVQARELTRTETVARAIARIESSREERVIDIG